MGEIYRDSIGKGVTFDISGVLPTSAKFTRGSGEYVVVPSANVAAVPYEITRLGGKFDVEWTYTVGATQYKRVDVHTVVTPLFTREALVEWDPDFAVLTDAQVSRLEKNVRSVIEHVTGQSFNYEYDVIEFKGSGGAVVSLPRRLVSATGLYDASGGLALTYVRSGNDGWTLTARRESSWIDSMTSSNPIRNPFKSWGTFDEDSLYRVAGYFGYESVPEDVALCARLLAEDYGCDESIWRDRYIDNIRAADWRFEFGAGAFRGTGNVKVDQILQKYTLNRMAIL